MADKRQIGVRYCGGCNPRYDRVALVTDIRGGQTFDGLFDALHELHRMGCAYKILFVEASVETIIKRYKETRRMHPLSSTSRCGCSGMGGVPRP